MSSSDVPEVLEKLESLDDAVFDAINGSDLALECLKRLWPETLAGLGETLVADSREQLATGCRSGNNASTPKACVIRCERCGRWKCFACCLMRGEIEFVTVPLPPGEG